MSLHWKTLFDLDGEPYGQTCGCKIGKDHGRSAVTDDLTEMKQHIAAAHTEICEIAKQGIRRWRMCIPAQPDRDSDLLISRALKDAEELAEEVERLRAHILDIDAHATPYSDIPDDPGYVGTYLLTAGALHRALGTIGHTAPSCEAEVAVKQHEDMLSSIVLYIDWRYITRQLTTEQKELFADALEREAMRAHGPDGDEPDPEMACLPSYAPRWWRPDAEETP